MIRAVGFVVFVDVGGLGLKWTPREPRPSRFLVSFRRRRLPQVTTAASALALLLRLLTSGAKVTAALILLLPLLFLFLMRATLSFTTVVIAL